MSTPRTNTVAAGRAAYRSRHPQPRPVDAAFDVTTISTDARARARCRYAAGKGNASAKAALDALAAQQATTRTT